MTKFDWGQSWDQAWDNMCKYCDEYLDEDDLTDAVARQVRVSVSTPIDNRMQIRNQAWEYFIHSKYHLSANTTRKTTNTVDWGLLIDQ